MTTKMHIGYDLSWIQLEGRWRLPGSWTNAHYPDMRFFKELALIAERGLMDFMFWGDGTGIPSTWKGNRDDAVRWGVGWPRQDMSPYIAALSQITSRIGFGLTYSSTYMHPFYTSRLLNSLDHVTGGRIAFNVVASSRKADAANYGFDELMEHDQRYERMEEFVDVCKALWASVAPDAFILDREQQADQVIARVRGAILEGLGKIFLNLAQAAKGLFGAIGERQSRSAREGDDVVGPGEKPFHVVAWDAQHLADDRGGEWISEFPHEIDRIAGFEGL